MVCDIEDWRSQGWFLPIEVLALRTFGEPLDILLNNYRDEAHKIVVC